LDLKGKDPWVGFACESTIVGQIRFQGWVLCMIDGCRYFQHAILRVIHIARIRQSIHYSYSAIEFQQSDCVRSSEYTQAICTRCV